MQRELKDEKINNCRQFSIEYFLALGFTLNFLLEIALLIFYFICFSVTPSFVYHWLSPLSSASIIIVVITSCRISLLLLLFIPIIPTKFFLTEITTMQTTSWCAHFYFTITILPAWPLWEVERKSVTQPVCSDIYSVIE